MTVTAADYIDDAVDLAQLLGNEVDPTELLGVFASHRENAQPLTEADLTSKVDSVDRTDAEMLIGFIRTRGYVSDDPDDGAHVIVDECIDLFVATREVNRVLKRVEATRRTPTVDPVCTLPSRDPSFQSMDPVDFGMQQITTRLLSICRNATEELVLTSPFLEVDGMEWLLPGLEGALERGVDITLVSRELRQGQPNHDAVRELFSISQEKPGTLRVYDYYEPSESGQAPEYTLHSKVLVADRTTAYIGSANFTKYGFQENLEVGVVVESEAVKSLTDLVAFLVAESAVAVSR